MKSNSNKNLWYVLGGVVVIVLVIALGTSLTGQATGTCTDSDGSDIYTQGEVRYILNGAETKQRDNCVGNNSVKEYICKAGRPASSVITCQYGCSSGACLRSPPPKPDLTITSHGPSNFAYKSNSQTDYDYAVTIKNVGTAATDGNVLITALLRLGDLNSYVLSQSQPRSLAPSEEITLNSQRLTCNAETSYQTTVRADQDNRITESDENNNLQTSTFTCPRMTAPVADVDLIIMNQEILNMRANDTNNPNNIAYTHTITVQNLGTTPTGSFYLWVNIQRTGLDGSVVTYSAGKEANLAAGASTDLIVDKTCTKGVFYDEVLTTVNAPYGIGNSQRSITETVYTNNVDETEFQC